MGAPLIIVIIVKVMIIYAKQNNAGDGRTYEKDVVVLKKSRLKSDSTTYYWRPSKAVRKITLIVKVATLF